MAGWLRVGGRALRAPPRADRVGALTLLTVLVASSILAGWMGASAPRAPEAPRASGLSQASLGRSSPPPPVGSPTSSTHPSFRASGLNVTHNFMPWVCQFCTWAGSNASFAAEYAPYAENITQLSPEMYDLCTTSPYFCSRGYENTANDLRAFAHQYKIAMLPMLTSGTLTTIQGFVDTPSEWTPFINAAVTTAVTYGYAGYNIDWEPGSDTTVAGGYEMAHFLDQFANASHAQGLIVTQDFARWDPNFWNLAAYAQTTTDIEMDMNYECPGSTFTSYLTSDLSTFPLTMLGEALDPESGCSDAQMTSLFSQVQTAGVANIEWWALDDAAASLDNAHQWTAVHDFVYDGANNRTTAQAYASGSWGLNVNEHPTAGGGDLSLFTLGTDEQGYTDASISSASSITSVTVAMQVSLNSAHYRIYEGNVSATGTVLSSWVLPDANGTLSLGAPTGGTATSIFFELASAPGGTVGGYQVGFPGTYADFQVTLNGGGGSPLTVAASSNRTSATVGMPISFTSTPSGGSGTYSTYAWRFGDGTTAAIADPAHSYTTAGTFHAIVNVTDSASHAATSNVLVLTIASVGVGLSVTSSANRTVAYVGEPVGFTSSVSGGTPAYSYAWAFGDTATSTAANPAHAYASAGTFVTTLTVTDSASHTATATPISIVVRAAPSVLTASLTESASNGPVGKAVDLTATASGGTLPYVYSWTGLPTGCAGANSASLSCTPTAAGTFVVGVTVSDASSPVQQVSRSEYYNVSSAAPPLSGYLSASSPAGAVGVPVDFAATVSGGTFPYQFLWAGLPTGCSGSDQATISCTPTGAGPNLVQVTVSDSGSPTQSKSWSIYYNVTASGPVNGNSSPGFLGLSSLQFDVLLLVVGVAVVAALAAVAIRRRRRGSPLMDDHGSTPYEPSGSDVDPGPPPSG